MSRTYTETASGGKTFHSVFDGKFSQRVEQGSEGAIEREKKDGGKVYEIYKSGIIGMLKSGCIAKKDVGGSKFHELQMNIDDDAQLQIPMYLLKDIAECLPALDPTKEVKIGIYKTKRDKTRVNISQEEVVGSDDWKQLPLHYTKWTQDADTKKWTAEGMNGIPEVTYDEDEEEWDFKAQEKFLKAEVRNFFLDMEEASLPEVPSTPSDGDEPLF